MSRATAPGELRVERKALNDALRRLSRHAGARKESAARLRFREGELEIEVANGSERIPAWGRWERTCAVFAQQLFRVRTKLPGDDHLTLELEDFKLTMHGFSMTGPSPVDQQKREHSAYNEALNKALYVLRPLPVTGARLHDLVQYWFLESRGAPSPVPRPMGRLGKREDAFGGRSVEVARLLSPWGVPEPAVRQMIRDAMAARLAGKE